MQNDGGITASGAFFDSVVAKSDFVNSGYILSVIFQIVATVRLILSGLVGLSLVAEFIITPWSKS